MTQPQSLDAILQAWGDWVVQENPEAGGVQWITTDYSTQPSLANYMQYQLTITFLQNNFSYSQSVELKGPPVESQAWVYTNNSPEPTSRSLKYTQTTTQSISVTATETLNVGQTMTATVDVPEIAKANGTDTM